jgi:TolA-binding protein
MLRRILALVCWTAVIPAALGAEPAPAPLDTAAELKTLREQLRTLSGNVTQIVERVSEQETQIGQLRQEMTALTNQINEEIVKQQEILEAIAHKDSSGLQVPRLSAAMQSNEFRQEMRHAVNDSLSTTGTLKITNRTNDFHRIFVNRVEFSVSAGKDLTLQVPVGTVSTQLPGRDLKNWTVAAPSYEQSIEIVPEATSAPVYVARPIVPEIPVYYGTPPVAGTVWYYWP